MDKTTKTFGETPEPNGKGNVRWTSLKRGISLSVALTLSVLILTSVLPPLVADQTDRAVVDAPAMLLTAPIAGEVTKVSVRPGAMLGAGASAAEIVNNKFDRSTLIELESKHADSEESLRAVRRKREGDVAYLTALSDQIDKQAAIMKTRYRQQLDELQTEVGAAKAAVDEKKLIVDRQADMVARAVASPEMGKAANEQLTAAKFQWQGALAKLQQKQAQLDSADQNIFVGDDARDVAALIQKKRDMELDVQRLNVEEEQLASAVQDQGRLMDAERDRSTRLARSSVEAPQHGEVLSVEASVGRHVNPGDTLARMVDCDTSFVVAIFSYREASDLTVGSRVSIDAGPAVDVSGAVMQIVPKTSDKVDETYALPFPQTERRELFVLIHPDRPIPRQDVSSGSSCDIGRWVTVTRDHGWIPSTSIVWTHATRQIGNWVQGLGVAVLSTLGGNHKETAPSPDVAKAAPRGGDDRQSIAASR